MTKSRNRQFADLADSASIIDGSTASYTTAEETKLAGIEASATADQTAAEIRTLVESATDSNVFTDADHTKLNGIAASANNYVHPNHSGEVTSSADGATVIASNVVDEDNLKVSNSPTNGYFLSAQSGNTGGLTWAAPPAGYSDSDVDAHLATATVNLDASNDRLGIGTSSPQNKLDIEHTTNGFLTLRRSSPSSGTGEFAINVESTSQPTFAFDSTTNLVFGTSTDPSAQSGFTERARITNAGVVQAATFNATSDATLKTNIVPIQNPLDILEKITGVSFDWRDNEGSAEGVLAQDVEQVLPNAVSTDEKGKKSVSYNNLVGVLIEAVKGQQEQINKLKERLNGLSD